MRIVALGVILLSLISPFDFLHRLIELFSHFKALYFLGALFCVLYFLFLRRFWLAGLLCAVAVLNLCYLVPWYLPNTFNLAHAEVTKPTTPIELKIIQSNVYKGNDNYQSLLNFINTEDPDIFTLQEFTSEWKNALKNSLPLYPYKFEHPAHDAFGIALYSKYPFDSIKTIRLGQLQLPSIEAKFTVQNKTFTMLSTHAMAPVNHPAYLDRNDQLIQVANYARKTKEPLIIIGDLNISMWSSDFKPLIENTDLRNARKSFGINATWPALGSLALTPIDHCLVSKEFNVLNFYSGAFVGSDHLPIVVELRF